ncbi:MAG: hypothetical protein O3B41_09925 [Bacteroidetes bacterium]|nr:hypothetical protein [Bacteroidota bacterium]
MRKRRFVKFQLFLLVIAVGLLVWRMNSSGPKGDGFVALANLDVNSLYSSAFAVEDTIMVHIQSEAAFESDDLSAALAVYPWIIDHASDEVVWKPSPVNTSRDGVRAVISDSLTLLPGTYVAYFTTYGPTSRSSKGGSFLGLTPHWTNDSSPWMLSLTTSGGISVITDSKLLAEKPQEQSGSGPIWSMVPTFRNESNSQMIQVTEAGDLQIDLTLAVCQSNCDRVELFRLPETTPIWQLTLNMTEEAGGSVVNRSFSGTVPVEPGLYKIEVTAGTSQAYGNWRSNPPYLPDNWGVKVISSDSSKMRVFDPWSNGEPLVSMLRVGSDEDLSMTLEIDNTLSVVVYGMGELGGTDSSFDYGWIEKEGRANYVWVMSYDASTHAGGDHMNRTEMTVLTLDPGRYFIRFKSDGTHNFGNWNKSEPESGERWGIALFAMNPEEVTAASVRVKLTEQAWTTDTASDGDMSKLGSALVVMNGLGNEAQRDQGFTLEGETKLKIIALGELTSGSSYDYGWIKRVSTGEKVWEMTYGNTVEAGGADRNRRFSGTITLGAGEYMVHFQTDFSHSYGNFDEDQPENGQDWGIAVYNTVE